MEFSMAGTVLTRDLVAAEGTIIAARGDVVDLQLLKDVAAGAPRGLPHVALHQTVFADDVLRALEAPALEHICFAEDLRGRIADIVSEVRLPEPVWVELEALRREDPLRAQHGVWTALVAARMFGAALGVAPGLLRLVAGALVHDIGMRHAAPRLRWKREHLTKAEALALEDHPILGALLLAHWLGDAPAVHFALLHHVRAGQGYPKISGVAPLRGLDVVAVASAFAAMIAERPYRPRPFNARGAADQLLEEAHAGLFDARAVRLLVHCLRGERGRLSELELARRATGFRPEQNNHGLVRPGQVQAGSEA
jgi:HD-GYP domain-containing protein (c-di-GMP phosphodiesterase class II)